ncbi:MAG TPA: TetR/AcrR family transcriptional regulator [Nocardioides sp.]|jgi:AcrR family transcriptional regulator|nr:TetR/AcrR family transcriptional regulator [Nocardioides sp.]
MTPEPSGSPRPSARERTRRLLSEAARELLRTGGPLTVQAAAERAGVSRATAYRYFPNNDSVRVHATMPLVDGVGLNPPTLDQRDDQPHDGSHERAPQGLPDKASTLVRTMGAWAFDHEHELRTFMRLSLAPPGPDRIERGASTNRDTWIATLLEGLPDHVPQEARDRLSVALTPLFGADAVIWSTDIARVDRETALDVMEWMAAALVRATLDESG